MTVKVAMRILLTTLKQKDVITLEEYKKILFAIEEVM